MTYIDQQEFVTLLGVCHWQVGLTLPLVTMDYYAKVGRLETWLKTEIVLRNLETRDLFTYPKHGEIQQNLSCIKSAHTLGSVHIHLSVQRIKSVFLTALECKAHQHTNEHAAVAVVY